MGCVNAAALNVAKREAQVDVLREQNCLLFALRVVEEQQKVVEAAKEKLRKIEKEIVEAAQDCV